MELNLPNPNLSPEAGERKKPELSVSPDRALSNSPEEIKTGETREVSNQGAAQGSAPVVALPQVVVPVYPAVSQPKVRSTDDSDNPLVAADDDVIEKAWVDKAKKIVETVKDDPYKQENEVSKLQADYLKKRYGKIVKTVSE